MDALNGRVIPRAGSGYRLAIPKRHGWISMRRGEVGWGRDGGIVSILPLFYPLK